MYEEGYELREIFVKKIVLQCPICKKGKLQELPEKIFLDRQKLDKEIVAILIPENTICPHGFIVEVDENFSIRDAISIDKVQETRKKQLISLKSIEDMIAKLSPNSVKNILSKL